MFMLHFFCVVSQAIKPQVHFLMPLFLIPTSRSCPKKTPNKYVNMENYQYSFPIFQHGWVHIFSINVIKYGLISYINSLAEFLCKFSNTKLKDNKAMERWSYRKAHIWKVFTQLGAIFSNWKTKKRKQQAKIKSFQILRKKRQILKW